MANPVWVDCISGQWIKVATAVTSGVVHKHETIAAQYLQTYKLTGEAAPTLITEGVRAFEGKLIEEIGHSVAIDVYIWVVGDIDGRVRVDV